MMEKLAQAVEGVGARPHRKKSFLIFPSPAGKSLTKLSLSRNYDVIYKLFLPRESLESDIPAHPLSLHVDTITYKFAVYAPAERADTLSLFHLYHICTIAPE
jgi:hypothetical protein